MALMMQGSLMHQVSSGSISRCCLRQLSTLNNVRANVKVASKSFRLVVVGGGAGGCATAAKFASKLGEGKVAVIEPSESHYYQPLWTLVGGGQKSFDQSVRPMESVLPSKAEWLKTSVVNFEPEQNAVVVEDGSQVFYDYLVVAVGIQLDFHKIKGLPEAFAYEGIGSNFSKLYVDKTWKAIKEFGEGNAIFTFPNTPIKCAGAPQKIMYMAEDYLRRNGRRSGARFEYHTSLPNIFGVKKYADELWKICEERDINVTLRSNLVEVRGAEREAIFQNVDHPDKLTTVPYSMLHVTPPMSAPEVLKRSKSLTDANGFVDVDKETLRHKRFPNVFSIGDCNNVPTSKTAAAVASQLRVLRHNLSSAMNDGSMLAKYDGYTSCPLVTGYNEKSYYGPQKGKCILAEFDFSTPPEPLETFPFNQGRERRLMYALKAHMMPKLYWGLMLTGFWEGPRWVRKLLHLGMSR